MAQKILILLLLVTTIYLATENANLKKTELELNHELQSSHKLLQQEKSTDQELRQKLSNDEALRQQQREITTAEIQVQQARVSQIQKSMEDLPTSPDDHGAVDSQRLQMNKERLKDLETKLKQASQARKEVTLDKNQSGQIQKAQTKNEIEYANGQIRLQEEAIKSTASTLNFWLRQKKDLNATAKISEYEQQLKNQRESLRLMQQQKLGIKNNLQSKTAALQNQAAEENADIQDSEGQLRAQITQLQQEQKDLQAGLGAAKKNKDQIQSQRRQLQQTLDLETLKLKNLESTLQAENAEQKKFSP